MLESNVYPGSLQPEDLGTREEEAATWCQVCSTSLTSPSACSVCPLRRAKEGVERSARTGPGEWSVRGSTAGRGTSVGTWWGEYLSTISTLLRPSPTRLQTECGWTVASWWPRRLSGREASWPRWGSGKLCNIGVQYTGEVVSREELEARLTTKYRYLRCRICYVWTSVLFTLRPGQKLHMLPLGEEAVVDATLRGGLARLASHSCGPNTEVVTWLVEVEGRPQACLAMYRWGGCECVTLCPV